MVSVGKVAGVAEVARLHETVHRVVDLYRDSDDWWGSPLGTALVAVGRSLHPPVFHEAANAALDRLKRWHAEGQAIMASADVAALALTARAAAALQSKDPELVRASTAAVEALATRESRSLPMLHAALAAWALDDLVPDRSSPPWPKLYTRLSNERVSGVDEPLRQLALGISRDAPTAGKEMLPKLLAATADNPGLVDASQLLWALSVAAEFVKTSVPSDDSGLALLYARRTDLMQFVSGSVTESTFLVPEVSDFDPEGDASAIIGPGLSSFDALLMDAVTAPSAADEPWLRKSEAAALFADEMHGLRRARDKQVRCTAASLAAAAALAGVVAGLVVHVLRLKGVLFGSRLSDATSAAAVASLLSVVAIRVWQEVDSTRAPLRELMTFALGAAVVLGLFTADHLSNKPKSSPVVTGTLVLYLGLIGAGVLALAVGLISKKRPRG